MRKIGTWLAGLAARIDVGLTFLAAVFVLLMPVGPLLRLPTPNLAELGERLVVDDDAAYAAAIAGAAVRHPDDEVRLRTIAPEFATVRVATFAFGDPSRAISDDDVWVALPDELLKVCANVADPARRLVQLLGLPPDGAASRKVYTLEVARAKMARACVNASDLATATCSAGPVGSAPASAAASGALAGHAASAASAANGAADPKANAALLAHAWNSYRTGFRGRSGYPFTGMGWTYDWADVPHHVGVSEFLVERAAPVDVIATQSAAEFCTTAKAAP